MFDAATAHLLQSAPALPRLDPQVIPALLTRHYANLVSARLRGNEGAAAGAAGEVWPLERIADTFELIVSLQGEDSTRRASAFVAGTAQQILAKRQAAATSNSDSPPLVDINRVDPAIAAALLFLAAEQYADANESAFAIRTHLHKEQLREATILSENIADLARGRLNRIVERATTWRKPTTYGDMEEQAVAALLETLITGLEILASQFLGAPVPKPSAGRFDTPRDAFKRVLALSAVVNSTHYNDLGGPILNAYAGPHHLASLLLAAYDGISSASLTKLPPPTDASPDFWKKWLSYRAHSFPFIWPNHRQAIKEEFHQSGKSAVVILPTGAGKTTISSLKIAGVLARKKKVIFLAPTHALVEQLTADLQEMFPKEILGSVVSSDFDLIFQDDSQLQEIEVMTPERCLAMLSFAPDAFSEVSLLVFDECHLLSPQSGKIRRAIDGMLCVLGFNHTAPDADMLFLSAMLKNGPEFSEWIAELTARDCVCVDILWKPSRQARGVVIYQDGDLESAKASAAKAQAAEDKKKGKPAKDLRAAAKKALKVHPFAIWGLRHNWLNKDKASCIFRPVLDDLVTLAGHKRSGTIELTPNANKVGSRLAVAAAKNGLKSIVFVNTKGDAISVAREISTELNENVAPTEAEQALWDALAIELGDLKHALLPEPSVAVPHNSSMLRLEREISERMFRRHDGAKVIVATPTLAQGLNLPAQLAILAGDRRADADKGGRQDLEAHEILNAAARAGRAGHLANGIVLLIPEPIISFPPKKTLSEGVVEKLKSILPEDDRCVVVSDPLEIVLDRIMERQIVDRDVRYIVNRMAALREATGSEEPTLIFDLQKSYGAYAARKRKAQAAFDVKIAELKNAIKEDTPGGIDNTLAVLASQSGLSMDLLLKLRKRVVDATGSLPLTVRDWLIWTIEWLISDDDARDALLHDVKRSVLGATGKSKNGELTGTALKAILPGLLAWIAGVPISDIERELGGDPDSDTETRRVCPRARELIGTVIPRGVSFVMGLVSHVVGDADVFEGQEDLDPSLVDILGTAVRRGFDAPEKIAFAGEYPGLLSRVQIHQAWLQNSD